ncbi:mechanosensitive ion channel domain-containing protein [Anthocerotibacter panamensis]|uniref:mechanosensitive ion channel domain-containing protein n=1 Tax=Anthocerotibacter panamensis TaxID=2857077 RepID=UPI001C407834|nr:mechanosensitive ion channel domain-containing protein [Anthocerotibacter panamensis]
MKLLRGPLLLFLVAVISRSAQAQTNSAVPADPSSGLNQAVVIALAVLVGTLLVNLLVQTGSRRLQERFTPMTKALLRLMTVPLQLLVLLVGLYWAIASIPPWQPGLAWFSGQITGFMAGVRQIFFTEVVTLGKARLSLISLLVIGGLGVAIVLVGRSLRDWLKERVLASLGLDKGNREAIAGVAFYVLVGLSFLVLLQASGIDLSSLTVFAGVLGIGIGFGLQNVASNFISGVTILLEQPIKAGDFVEVNGLLGTVQRISVRSTVIETPDGVSIIVPNSKFIENNVINWSYSRPLSRLHIPIGVAYRSDPAVVTEALLTAARRETRVLRDPAPQVWLKAFGSDALEFELLVWVPVPQQREPLKSALNYLIKEELRRQDVEIPFSQQDIYIRSWGKLEQSLAGPSPEPPEPMAMAQSLRDLLLRVNFFQKCSESDLRMLVEQGYQASYRAGEIICRQGDPGMSLYLVLVGLVGVMAESSGQLLAELPVGAICGEIALLTGTNRTATLKAIKDTTLFIVDRHALQMVLSQHQSLAEQISQSLAQRTQELKDLGLFPEMEQDTAERATPFELIRGRIRQLFGI